ncbi:hypothetical protein LRS06_08205 [Hymenobacter sp. J193]|uniref:hypothetical protein n=1 Tax=Hymenobacter sp. J193 TaxID=2898429 RepID=UPI002150D6F0|nr:hypothetical protein [Hymenobacter sp. J193]MCR5887761.1 hypothetical protein [Hymenobacter sp. J193]
MPLPALPFPGLLRVSAGQRRWLARYHGWLLGALWLLVQLLLLWKHGGPRTVTDSRRYLLYAQQIAEQWYFEHDHNLRYVGYPVYCSLWLKAGAGLWGMVLGQMVVAGLAARAFHRALLQLTGRRPVAAGATALLLWPDAQNLNAYILTESLFTSGILLCFWALTFASGRWGIIRLLVLALATALLRPNGFLVPLALAGAAGWQLWPRLGPRQRGVVVVAVVAAMPLLWVVLNKLLLTFTLIETYLRGEIIYLYPGWTVQPRQPLQLPPADLGPVLRLAYFILHNPAYFAQLALLKAFALFSGLKPYYSRVHIVAAVAVLYPCYWLAWRGSRAAGFPGIVRFFLVALIGLQALVVMLTIEDWDVRFLVPMLPAIFALAALGVAERLPGCLGGPPRAAVPETLSETRPAL